MQFNDNTIFCYDCRCCIDNILWKPKDELEYFWNWVNVKKWYRYFMAFHMHREIIFFIHKLFLPEKLVKIAILVCQNAKIMLECKKTNFSIYFGAFCLFKVNTQQQGIQRNIKMLYAYFPPKYSNSM